MSVHLRFWMLPASLVTVMMFGCQRPVSRIASSDVPATRPAAAGAVADPIKRVSVPVLRETAQKVQIRLVERRETTIEDSEPAIQELEIEVNGRLSRAPGSRSRDGLAARLTLDHIRVRVGGSEQPETPLRYDSAAESQAGNSRPLADLMQALSGAELTLRLGRDGQLIEARGLDALWRKAGVLSALPGLLAVQWAFRDQPMTDLLDESLFPAVPGDGLRTGDMWTWEPAADLPLAARLIAHLRCRVTEVLAEGPDGPVARIEAVGSVEPSPVLPGAQPGLRPAVVSSKHRAELAFAAGTGEFTQESRRQMEVLLTLAPPQGQERRTMRIRQDRRLTARREADQHR